MRKYASLEVLSAWRQTRIRNIKTAHRVAFDYEPRPGYLYVRSRMISSRTNDNHDTFPAEEIEKGYRSFLGKPVFVNHHNANHRRARGVIVAVALHRDKNGDGSPDTWVEGLMEVDAVRFPRLAKAILAGRVNRTSMGVDVDWSTCSACGNKATSPAEYCRHLPAMKGKKIRQRNQATGKVEEKLIHEVCAGLSFFENSLLVEDPADPTAYLLGKPDARGLGKAASKTAAAGDPDFRDHFGNTCRDCGTPVFWLKANSRHPGMHKHDVGFDDLGHPANPVDPADQRGRMSPATFGGTRCAVCSEPVKVNLRALGTDTGGWHHHDGMKRDHPAIPLDPQAVYDSIPGVRAQHDQARSHVREHLHRQFEQLSGGPLPRTPRGDEHEMPPDPFTAARKKPKKDDNVRGYSRDPRFDGVGLKKDRNGFYVHTHRSRSDSYPTVDDIPASEIEEIRSTGAKKAEGGDHPWFMNHPVSPHHIVASYNGASDDERALGDRWYSDAHHIAKVIGKGDSALGAGLLSAYSVRTLWPVNMFNASRAAHGDPPGPGTGAMGVHQKAAIRILAGEHHSKVLKAPKTASFAHLIEHGGDTPDDVKHGTEKVVIDRHAMSVAVGRRLTDEEKEGMPIGSDQHYEHVAHAYRHAARILSEQHGRRISPHQVQAATWLHQIRQNTEEDASGKKGGGGKGRVKLQDNSKTRWVEHHRHHHEIPEENMHYHGALDQWPEGGAYCADCTSDLASSYNPYGKARSKVLPFLCQDCGGKHAGGGMTAMPGHMSDQVARETVRGQEGHSRPYTADDQLRHSLSSLDDPGSWRERSDYCTGCGEPMMAPDDLRTGDDQFRPRSSQIPHLCVNCADPYQEAAPYQRHRPGDDLQGTLRRTRPWGEGDSLPPSQSSRKTAYGETRVPPQVDTLRMDECPVCGEHNVWSGSRCPVCGFVVPPSVFRDPDTSKAQEVRDQLDSSGEVDVPPDSPDAAQPDAQLPVAQVGSGEDADGQLVHPDQIAPDGVPTVQGGDDAEGAGGTVPGDAVNPAMPEPGAAPDPDVEQQEAEAQEAGELEDPEGPEGAVPPEDEAGEDDGEMYAEELICPACGTTFEADAAAQPGVPCPACGMAALHPADEDGEETPEEQEEDEEAAEETEEGDEDGDPRKEQEDPSEPGEPGDEEEDEEMPESKTAAAVARAQARRLAELTARNEVLEAQLRFLANAAGVEGQFAEIGRQVMRRHADIMNPASPVPDPPQAPPTQTTEQALQPESMDNAGRPGTTPGANSRVPAQQTTTAITPGVEMQTPPATNLIDVTAPVTGTNPSQDGGVPLDQRRIETDVRIDPDPLKAHGPGIGGQGDNGAAFPWLLDARTPGQQGGQSGSVQASRNEADASRRTFAAIRLAKLRVQAGLAQGDELAVAERIERDASLSVPVIEHEITTLEQVGQRQPQRPVQRTAARSVPSLASVGAASQYAPAVADDLDGSDLFL